MTPLCLSGKNGISARWFPKYFLYLYNSTLILPLLCRRQMRAANLYTKHFVLLAYLLCGHAYGSIDMIFLAAAFNIQCTAA